MSSFTLLYKFGAQTRFEALPLPGTAAKLFDVKVAIAKTKKLDSGRGIFDFDLSVKNADTDEEYVNEGMFIARGTRIIVCRRPADRGCGFLARMKGNEQIQGGGVAPAGHQPYQKLYMIDSRSQEDEDEEFVRACASATGVTDEEKDHAALQKALLSMNENGSTMRNAAGNNDKPNRMFGRRPATSRPNADPEIREMEKNWMQKKRVLKSIPRPLRNMTDQLSSSSTANQSGEGVSSGALFQPNKLAFRDLVEKSGRRHGLEYALKVTSTPIPEHIQCGICQGVARNAMLLPWDPEGRTACEICIREGLARNGFLRCPLTGEEGVSPDDLHPNAGLRKAADLFVESVMERVDEIENQSADDEESAVGILDGAVAEHGNVGSKMMTTVSRKEPEDENGPFGFGGDEFGGDVFAVEEADQKVKARKVTEEPKSLRGLHNSMIEKQSLLSLKRKACRQSQTIGIVVNDAVVVTGDPRLGTLLALLKADLISHLPETLEAEEIKIIVRGEKDHEEDLPPTPTAQGAAERNEAMMNISIGVVL